MRANRTLIAAGLLYLHVSLTRRFEGRLWMLPSRIYSDALTVSSGDPLDPAVLTGRLDRSGYARTGRSVGMTARELLHSLCRQSP